MPYVGTVAPSGWILLNDGTIGSALSGATTRANADTEALYTLIWDSMANGEAPVTGGRGVSAAADFSANKPIRLPLSMGRAFGVAGAGSGLTSRANGATVGAETHQLSLSEMASHNHSLNRFDGPFSAGVSFGDINYSTVNGSGSNETNIPSSAMDNTGGDTPHNNMQPTTFLNAIIKL